MIPSLTPGAEAGGCALRFQRRPAYDASVAGWIAAIRRHADVVLASTLCGVAVAVTLGPGYFFAFAYLAFSLYIARTALRR